MKKFTKIMLIVAGAMASVGVTCMVIAFVMGLTTDGLIQMVQDGKFAFDMTDVIVLKQAEITTEEKVQVIADEEVGEKSDEWNDYFGEECNAIDLEFAAGTLEIYYDDVEEIQIQHKNIDHIKAEVKNGVLKIGEELEISINDVEDRSLVVIIPNEMSFDAVDLEIGASLADIDGLNAKDISITIGAGQASISNITADNMELEVGAGEATVANLSVEKMDVEVGMGQVDLGLYGAQTDYDYNVECGMGNVVVGNYSYGGLGVEHHTQSHHAQNHHASKLLNVECGMGEVHVKFMQ